MAERTILNSVSTIDVYNTSLNVSLNISVNDASVTHSLAIKRGDTTITTSTFGALSVGTQTKIVSLTSTQRTAILNAMPDVASFNATYELTSLNNGVAVGTPSAASATIKLSNGYPTVADFTWADTNPKTLAMTGDSHYIIEGESDLYFYNVSATPYTGASIAQYILGDGLSDKNLRTTTGGTIHYGTVSPITAFDPESIGEIFVLAQDSRRREKSKSSPRTGWSYYSPPWNSSITVTRNASDASLIDIHLSGRFHTVNGLNWMTASFKYKLSSASTYSTDISLSVTTSGSSYSCDAIGLTGLNSSAFSEASQYDIVVTVSDALHDNSQSFVLPTTTPMLAFRDDAIGIGTVPSGTNVLELASDWIIRGAVENTTPTFTKTSGSSNIRSISLFRFGAVCQLMMSLELHTASVGDIMLEGTLSGVPVPLGNGIGSAVHLGGVVLGGRYWNSGGTTPTLTVRLGALNYTQPSSTTYGTAFMSLVFLTDD